MTTTLCKLFFAALIVCGPAIAPAEGPREVIPTVNVIRESFCYADADIFTVSLELEIRITNRSSQPIRFSSTMTPYVAKVASSLQAAQTGTYLYELAWTQFPTEQYKGNDLKLDPGMSVSLITGYDLLARYKQENNISKTVASGSYALQLTLRPEYDGKAKSGGNSSWPRLEFLETEPFIFQVPEKPIVANCDLKSKSAKP